MAAGIVDGEVDESVGGSIIDDPVIRRAADTLEQLKSVAQALRMADKAADAEAEALKEADGSKAELLSALKRRNVLRICVKAAIKHMESIKNLADELLLLRDSGGHAAACEESISAQCEEADDDLDDWREMLPPSEAPAKDNTGHAQDGPGDSHSNARAAQLDEELAAVRGNCPEASAELLCTAIKRLRAVEESVVFHAGLVKAQAEASSSGGYSKDNFAYGSTPYSTWYRVMSHPAVQKALHSMQELGGGGGEFVVFGSSSGWMVFYAGITYGVRSRGVELMPHLHSTAKSVLSSLRKTAPTPNLDVTFELGDMLDTDIRTCSILLLASQCWDAPLKVRVCAKIETELPAGALVIDYSQTTLGSSPAMTLVGEAQGGVSWNERQAFYVYSRV